MNHMTDAKNGGGSQAVLTASFELRNQFTKSGTTFERIQFERASSRTGNSGHTKVALPTIKRRLAFDSAPRNFSIWTSVPLGDIKGVLSFDAFEIRFAIPKVAPI